MKAAASLAAATLLAALALGAVLAGPAAAKGGYCQGVAAKEKAKKVASSGGVDLYKRDSDFVLCANRGRKLTSVYAASDRGFKPKQFLAQNWKCAAVLMVKRGTIPEIQKFDLKTLKRGYNEWASINQIAYGYASATVVSMVLSKNCVLVTGSVVPNGDGTFHRRLDYVNFNKGGAHLTFASDLNTNAELKSLKVKPKGKGAIVTWKQGGEKRTYEVPGT